MTDSDLQAGAAGAAYADVRALLPGANLKWMSDLRARAVERFDADGWPTTAVEEWRYTNLTGLGDIPLVPSDWIPAPTALPEAVRLDGASHRIVLVNGRFEPALSSIGDLPAGVWVSTLARTLEERPDLIEAYLEDTTDLVEERLSGINDSRPFALVALNTAMMTDGAVIRVERGVAVDAPIHVVHLAGEAAGMAQTRSLVIAGESAELDLVETYAPLGDDSRPSWTNSVVEIAVAANASVRHVRAQTEGAAAIHLGATRVRVDRDGRYRNMVLSIGARTARNEARVSLMGRGAQCRLDGVFLARGTQAMDHLTRIDHREPDGNSAQTYRGVIDDRARTAFQGKVRVSAEAVRSNAEQANNNLLLSDGARADSKPELEILTDDVACTHGSTVGDLDTDALFFLRARGIDERAARALLVEGFVGDLIDGVEHDAVRAHLARAFQAWTDRR